MIPSKSSAPETEVSELKTLVNNLLDKVNRLTSENTRVREEILSNRQTFAVFYSRENL